MADLVAQRPLLRRPARFRLILALYQHKFSVGGFWVAEVGGHRPQLLRVQAIVKAVFQTLNGRPLDGLFVGLDIGRGRGRSSFPHRFSLLLATLARSKRKNRRRNLLGQMANLSGQFCFLEV